MVIIVSMALFLSSCADKRPILVERRRTATTDLAQTKSYFEAYNAVHASDLSISVDSMEKVVKECAHRQAEDQRLIDSCNDELDRLK